MTDLTSLMNAIDQLPREELEQLHRYILQRRMTTVWAVPPEQIKAIETLLRPVHEKSAQMSEDEINAAIDEAMKN